jgi:hypothetical protein
MPPDQEEAIRHWAYILTFIGGCFLGLAAIMGVFG